MDNTSNKYYEDLKSKLYSAVISDSLDSFGFREQTMSPEIRPLNENMIVVGRAKTVLAADVYHIPEKHYFKQIEVLDSIRQGDVFVASVSGSKRSAFWGELMSTATKVAGGRGAVIDGLSRDTKKIIKLDFPVFSVGFRPTDSLGRNDVIDYDVPIECGGVKVNSGDLIFGDVDGVVVVPREIEKNVIQAALDKVDGENKVRDEILHGVKVSEVFRKYKIL
ncbi:demethylmenaquinone methyltransferase [Ferroplasma acidiphilum]|jgi:regulator of RNase E activity RraA|uniref:Demethylmenaquinone methyltransferase n=1 Tax=Ferroplasma acidiphilum TaxID=74969 RepID=A0A1V0N5A3_9ARCH|nr:RraA family protein [Ferroplasma acidiphilum]ARD85275.1 demethylmenaquinone methyltransferase [Ferroplasma acidiphilum]